MAIKARETLRKSGYKLPAHDRTDTISRKDFEEYQLLRFREQMRYAEAEAPHYRNLYKDAVAFDDDCVRTVEKAILEDRGVQGFGGIGIDYPGFQFQYLELYAVVVPDPVFSALDTDVIIGKTVDVEKADDAFQDGHPVVYWEETGRNGLPVADVVRPVKCNPRTVRSSTTPPDLFINQ